MPIAFIQFSVLIFLWIIIDTQYPQIYQLINPINLLSMEILSINQSLLLKNITYELSETMSFLLIYDTWLSLNSYHLYSIKKLPLVYEVLTKSSVMTTSQASIMIHNSVQVVQYWSLFFVTYIKKFITFEVRSHIEPLHRKINERLDFLQLIESLERHYHDFVRLVNF
jgi:hypothetical protein